MKVIFPIDVADLSAEARRAKEVRYKQRANPAYAKASAGEGGD